MTKVIERKSRPLAVNHLKTFGYRTYNFVDKDPEIDKLRTEIQKRKISYKVLADEAGCSLGTLLGWFNGRTRRPQHATIMAVWGALGYTMVTRRMK